MPSKQLDKASIEKISIDNHPCQAPIVSQAAYNNPVLYEPLALVDAIKNNHVRKVALIGWEPKVKFHELVGKMVDFDRVGK